jgi:putative DNA primase/helicase
MSTADTMTVLRSPTAHGAVKTFARTEPSSIAMTQYQRVKYWRASCVPVSSFEEMANVLALLVEDSSSLVVRGALKPGIDLSAPILRRIHGENATLIDVPRRWLHLDIDRLSAPHIDVIGDPSGAIDFALDAVATAAPELEGASCFAAFSSQAGVYDPSAAKLHFWFWLDRPYTTIELKRWAIAVNQRAGFALIDMALFNAAQPNYTARLGPLRANTSASPPSRHRESPHGESRDVPSSLSSGEPAHNNQRDNLPNT